MMATEEMVSTNAIIERIRKHAKDIDNTRVYWVMKTMKVGHVSSKSVDFMKTLIAVNDFGLPITASLITYLRGYGESSSLATLHAFGDKHLITLKRRDGGGQKGTPYIWFLSQIFAEMYYGKGRRGDFEQ